MSYEICIKYATISWRILYNLNVYYEFENYFNILMEALFHC